MNQIIKPLHGILALVFFFALAVSLINGVTGTYVTEVASSAQLAKVLSPTPVTFSTTTTTTNPVDLSVFVRDLGIGSTGSDVAALQDFLILAGYLAVGNSTGYFGVITQAALIDYQNANGITPATGYFGQITKNSMNKSILRSDDIDPVPTLTHILGVDILGDGQGSVISSPSGIDCESEQGASDTICSAVFTAGTTVTLDRFVTRGTAFAGWGGSCSGKGSCSITMSKDENVTASFEIISDVINPPPSSNPPPPPGGGNNGGGSGGGSGGSGSGGDSGCAAGNLFSTTTGNACSVSSGSILGCAPGYLYSTVTGQQCPASSGSIPGCAAGYLFSVVTGQQCPVTVGTPSPSSFAFTRDLSFGSRGNDVDSLQQFLIYKGFLSAGNTTGYFGSLTRAALIRYQQSMNITPAVGYFGSITRGVIMSTTVITFN